MTNQSFFNATFIARKARVLRNGEVPIILRITIAGQRAELNINRTVNPDMWVAAKGMSRGKSRADIELNRYLETVRAKLLAIHTQMVAEGALINCKRSLKSVPDSHSKMGQNRRRSKLIILEESVIVQI